MFFRPRATTRIGALCGLFTLLVVASLGAAPTSSAATVSITGLRAEATASRAIALVWDTAGANAYRVRFSTSSSMSSPDTWDVLGNRIHWTRTDANPNVSAPRLSPDTTYYFQVKAISLAKADLGRYSKVLAVRTKPASAFPELPPTNLVATADGAGSVYLAWTNRSPGLRYRVRYTTNPALRLTSWETVVVPATGGVVTGLAASTTYHFKARVIATDGKALSPYSVVETQVTAKATASPGISVSAYNVHKASSGPSWTDRRRAVAENITRQQPDVIALAEASPVSVVTPSGAKVKQYNDLLALINDDIPYRFVAAGNYTNGTKLAYNSRRLTSLNEGSKALSQLGEQRRYAVWAVFSDKASGKRVFVVATHLEPGKGSATDTTYNNARIAQAAEIVALAKAKNPKGHPVVVAGDFNSNRSTEPSNGPYDTLIAAGLVDPLDNARAAWTTGSNAIAETMVGVEYNSANAFETRARRTSFPIGTHVDYVLVSRGVRVVQYRMVVDVDAAGDFVGTIPSDHNQVSAVIRLP